jgi:N6-adenosine-specific RNA methylase IME4
VIDLRCEDVGLMLKSLPDECAPLITADPPWRYSDGGRDSARGVASNHYDGLPMEFISAHLGKTYRVAAQNAYLAVWCTFPMLHEWILHFNVFHREGWEYITGGAWGKTNGLGVGHHFRGDAEVVLLYKKGTPKPLATTSNLWLAPRIGHSEKPQRALRALVAMAVPQGGLVVDLYAGSSASMARACRALGRSYVGAELDPGRHAEAMQRMSQQEMTLLEASA